MCKYLISLASRYQCIGSLKYKYKVTNNQNKISEGIDVVWMNSVGEIVAAFEVDGGLRKRSIKKLKNISTEKKYWLYYGNQKGLKQFVSSEDPKKSISVIKIGNVRKILRPKKRILKEM